jgi:ADP-heptose:LPS heptosyltransferase
VFDKRKHIAIIRLSAMGDVAMIVPIILAFSKQYPEVKITVVSRPFFKPIFQNIENVTFFSVHTHHQHKGLLGILKLYKDLKRKNITHLADLHNVLRSKALRFLCSLNKVKTATTDKGRAERKQLTALKPKEIKPIKPMIERHLETFQKLGYSIDLSTPVFLPKEELPEKAKTILGEKKQKWIGIAPFAHYESKTYPIDLMQKVVHLLAENQNIKIILLGGGKHEEELLEKMANPFDNVYNFANKVSFQHELQLISNLDVMLSMDSGNAHLAAMYGIKTITIWGATHPYTGFAPYNQPIENCLTSDRNQYPLLPTSIYGNKKVAGYEDVMRSISVESVVDKVNSIFE